MVEPAEAESKSNVKSNGIGRLQDKEKYGHLLGAVVHKILQTHILSDLSLRVLAAAFPSYHSIKPADCEARASHDSARSIFEHTLYTSVRASGLMPEPPAD